MLFFGSPPPCSLQMPDRVGRNMMLLRSEGQAASPHSFLYQSDTVCCDTHACAGLEGSELQSEAFLEPNTCGTGSDNENVCSLQDTVCLPVLDVILPSCLLQHTNNVSSHSGVTCYRTHSSAGLHLQRALLCIGPLLCWQICHVEYCRSRHRQPQHTSEKSCAPPVNDHLGI